MDSPKEASPNLYLMAVLTAVLAGMFSVVGGYYTAKFQTEQAIAQRQLEYRVAAYSGFLEKTDRMREPVISQLLNVGSMADHLATDSEIQAFEDQIYELLRDHDIQVIYWQLNSDLNTLRLHGSQRVEEICSDILKSLLLRDGEIDWGKYRPEVTANYERWQSANGVAFGWEERVSKDERLMIVNVSMLTKALIEQLRAEIHGT